MLSNPGQLHFLRSKSRDCEQGSVGLQELAVFARWASYHGVYHLASSSVCPAQQPGDAHIRPRGVPGVFPQ